LYRQGVLKGGIHASIGQEGVAVGVCFALRPDDWITSTHRGHGHHLAKGADVKRLMAEIRGKETGYCHGRGGSMHVAAFDAGSLGAYPIVASGAPVGVGAALAAKMQGQTRVVAVFFGEGALGQGTLHESLNLVQVWKLPVLFVCENNRYAVSTLVERSIAVSDMAALASAHGMPGAVLDGQDVLAVYDWAGEATARAREGRGPSFLCAETYRFEGHYFGEPQVYRTKEEVVEARRSRDPIAKLEARMLELGAATQAELEALAAAANADVEAALEFAASSPEPDPATVAEYVYA
jgi:pyruvate dehydrogenase E1 component alpha subunit